MNRTLILTIGLLLGVLCGATMGNLLPKEALVMANYRGFKNGCELSEAKSHPELLDAAIERYCERLWNNWK